MTKQNEQNVQQPKNGLLNKVYTGAVLLGASGMAMANTDIDLTTGLAGVGIVAGLLAAGQLKALPTYVAWGIKKALSMLR